MKVSGTDLHFRNENSKGVSRGARALGKELADGGDAGGVATIVDLELISNDGGAADEGGEGAACDSHGRVDGDGKEAVRASREWTDGDFLVFLARWAFLLVPLTLLAASVLGQMLMSGGGWAVVAGIISAVAIVIGLSTTLVAAADEGDNWLIMCIGALMIVVPLLSIARAFFASSVIAFGFLSLCGVTGAISVLMTERSRRKI